MSVEKEKLIREKYVSFYGRENFNVKGEVIMGKCKLSLCEKCWTIILLCKLRIGWILYNLVYIHILRRKYPNEKFKRISFDDYYVLAMRDIFEHLGYDYDKVKEP